MPVPTEREWQIAHDVDVAIVRLSESAETLVDVEREAQRLIAEALAAYRIELATMHERAQGAKP